MLRKKISLILAMAIIGTSISIVNAKDYSKERIAGKNRYETSYKISNKFNMDNIKGVILASGQGFADALSGSALSKKYNAPILLMSNDENDKASLDFLKNLDKSVKIYILGGEGSVSKKTENMVKGIGFEDITRLGGRDRYETSYKISTVINMNNSKPIVIASGEGFADALSISTVASIREYPILLTSKNQLSQEIEEKIRYNKPCEIFIIGGEGSISKSVEKKLSNLSPKITRIAGKDRYETSQNVVNHFKLTGNNIVVASGQGFADALSGSALAAKNNAPILLVNQSSYKNQKKYIDKTDYNKLTFLGGEGSISKEIYDFFNNTEEDMKEDIYLIKDESLKVANKMGNTNANYALYGAVVPVKDKHYFWNRSKIYSINENGDINEEFKSRVGGEYNYYNGSLYGGKYNIENDKAEKIVEGKNIKKIKIYNDYIYYIENMNNIKRTSLDGKETEDIFSSKYSIRNFYINDNKIYFTGYEGEKAKTYSIDIKNLKDIKIISSKIPFQVELDYISNGKLYFTDLRNNTKRIIYRSNLDGSNLEKIHDNLPGNIVVVGKYIYTFWNEIGRFNLETKKYETLYKDKEIDLSKVGFTNNHIIFSNLYDFDNINIMNLDGSNLEKIDLTTI